MAGNAKLVAEMHGKYSAGRMFAAANKDMKRTAKQGKVLDNQFRLIRGGMGQMGHQVQDVAVQLQGGQNPFLILGQQGSQVASLFGPHGAVIGAFLAVGAAIASSMLPNLFGATEAMQKLNKAGDDLVDNFDKLNGVLKAEALRRNAEEIANNEKVIAKAEKAIRKIANSISMQNAVVYDNQELIDKLNEKIREEVVTIELARQAIVGLTKKTDETSDSTETLIEKLTDEASVLGKTREEQVRLTDAYKNATPENQKIIDQQLEKIAAHEQSIVKIQEEQKALDEAAKAEAKRQKEREKIEKETLKAAQKNVNEQIKAEEDLKRSFESTFDGITDGFVDAITGSKNFADAMKATAKSVVDSLIKMLIQKMIVDAAFNAITASISNSQLGINASQGYGRSLGGSDPFATANFAGGGYTGNRARSGGLDGKGGFAAILHPRETVVDHHQGQSTGSVIVNQTINVTTGVQQTVRAEIATLMPQIANAAKTAVVDARQRGGGYSKALLGA